jgi:hypothetical protein
MIGRRREWEKEERRIGERRTEKGKGRLTNFRIKPNFFLKTYFISI